jgi:hypothetical protein
MRWNSFSRSLLFAALAAAAVVPWLVVAIPWLGSARALAFCLAATTAVYVGGLVPDRARRARVFLTTAVLGFALVLVTRTLTEQVLGLAVLLAIVRSGFLHRAPLSRAVAIEAVLVGTGLLFARFLSGPFPGGVAIALWGFFLVQSFYFLIGGIRTREASGRHPDPFEEARARMLAILDVPPPARS